MELLNRVLSPSSGGGLADGDGDGRNPPGEPRRGGGSRPPDDSLPDPPDRPIDTYLDLGMAPESYVRQLVVDRGGHAWQGTVVEVTGWSSASVSRLLGGMEDAGLVERHRIGREKLVVLPDDDGRSPDA